MASFRSQTVPIDPTISDDLEYMKAENQRLKDEISQLKALFQNINVNQANSQANTSFQNPSTPSPRCKGGPRKSIRPEKLQSSKPSADFDLDHVELGHLNQKLLNSCYTLARVLMNRGNAKSLVPNPPTEAERQVVEGFFNVSPEPPSDAASHQL
ncbi:hypothetical protein O181_049028 [Austropuccinia psidii MF-1]|uniref:Uncharacterized protein n=1 Tax=Austropuccinia psidii MF-1 TaxID=1389203 RepID=A0A9Q3DWQ4_9BASI|nr:hypothetical protein [Austropuccinia psidii MF-1]